MTDIKTLENHHNALQISFNLLLLTLAEKHPEVVDDWLAALLHTIDTEHAIPAKQREVMQGQFVALAEHMKAKKSGATPRG